MRPWLRILVMLVLLTGIGLGAWCYRNRNRLACQWASYRVGAARSFHGARAEIAWFETGPDRQTRLRHLVGKWGTGNRRFDLYLARYVTGRDSSELLRKTFSLELGWREELLPRWAHYWRWQAPREPDQEIASILDYLHVLISADPPKPVTWREVLQLQAIFQLSGQPELAKRLSPVNWPDRYRRWLQRSQGRLPHVPRPAKPLPEG